MKPLPYESSSHWAPDCMLVHWNHRLTLTDQLAHGDELCLQGHADLNWGGMNEADAKGARGRNE